MTTYLKFDKEKGVWPRPDSQDEALATLKLVYEGAAVLEPFYYLAVQQLSNRGYTVLKISDWYSMSERSQEWGNQQMKLHHQINDASTLMRYVNEMLKSYIAMKKDHQRIKESLEFYGKEGKPPDDLSLKGIWVDFVDTKTGNASLAQVSRNLEMFAVRDWFFRVDDPAKVDEELKETNVRIRNYLKRKLAEYQSWKKHWKTSLMEFDKILEERMKSNKKNIDLYKQWTKPLLHNIDALQMGPKKLRDWRFRPELLKVTDNLLSEVKIVAFSKGVDLGKNKDHPWMDSFETKTRITQSSKKVYVPYVGVLEIDFIIIGSSPQGAHIQTEMTIKPRIYTSEAFYKKYQDWQKDDVEKMFEDMMLNEEFTDKVEEEIKEKPKESNLAFAGLYNSLKSHFKKKKEEPKKGEEFKPKQLSLSDKVFGPGKFGANAIARKLLNHSFDGIYDIQKKAFFSLSWPVDVKEWSIKL